MARKSKKSVSRKKRAKVKTTTTKRRRNARANTKNAALQPRFFSKVKQEFHDFDYVPSLDEKAKEFLNGFTEETLNARFNHEGKKLYKSKKKKRAIYNENNARQRDIYAQSRATGRLYQIDPEKAIEVWQERYINHDFEFEKEEKMELLTKRQYIALKESGAEIPFEMIIFYEEYYKLK